jgi:hypothetical protein
VSGDVVGGWIGELKKKPPEVSETAASSAVESGCRSEHDVAKTSRRDIRRVDDEMTRE